VLVAAAAAAACTGAVLLRKWDRAAGKRVAELTVARQRDEWRTDERIAELETDVEESREIRRRLEAQLRARRAELSRLRGEHAELLRRYATAESERARALEGRRRLALEAATPRSIPAAGAAPEVNLTAYLKAADALRNLGRNAARQQVTRTVEQARRRDAQAHEGDEPKGRHAQDAPDAEPQAPAEAAELVAVAAAVLPYAKPGATPPRTRQGGFDFFGLKDPAAGQDLADVVGDEAYAEHEAGQDGESDHGPDSAEDHEDHEVIDLTAHDETEQIDVRMLRAHS
jgi:hypothetical protein